MPNKAAVTVVKIKNFITGTREICAQRLITSAVEQPMIKRPPMISPQRTLLCSMKAASTSANGLRGGFRTGGAGVASSESLDQSPSCGPDSTRRSSANVTGVMNGRDATLSGSLGLG